MKRVSHDFRELGLLINLLVVIGFVVLAVKAFAPTVQPSLAQADIAAAVPTAVATVEPTATALPAATATTVSHVAAPATVAATVAVTVAATVAVTVAVTTTNNTAPVAEAATPPLASDAVVAVVNKGTCNACHVIPGVDGAVGIVGPNLSNIGAEASTRIPGYSAEQYLHESIVDPNAFIAPQCPFGSCTPGAMPATLVQTLTPAEIQIMVDYLLTLQSPQ